MENTEKIKIVVLESPYDTWSNPQVGNLLMSLIGVKLRGYGHEYPYGVLPVDGADLISSHLAICREEENGTLNPLMAIRWTSMKKCRLHYTSFPGMTLLQQAGAVQHVKALEEIIANADERDVDLVYSGSLSIDPSQRGNKERSLFFRELLTMMYVRYQREIGFAELMAGGTCRFKIEKWLGSIGHEPLGLDGKELSPIEVKHLAKEKVQIMHLREFSFEAMAIAQKWQHLWDERLVIDVKTHGDAAALKRAA